MYYNENKIKCNLLSNPLNDRMTHSLCYASRLLKVIREARYLYIRL